MDWYKLWKSIGATPDAIHYKERKLLTKPERLLYWRLRNALPECVILTQVELSRVIDAPENDWGAFKRINGKSLDFVICLEDSTVVAAIELDDRTHSHWKRVKADTTKNAAMKAAGVTLLRWKVGKMPTEAQIRKIFTE